MEYVLFINNPKINIYLFNNKYKYFLIDLYYTYFILCKYIRTLYVLIIFICFPY